MAEEIRVVLFGKTGVGKSFLANNILNKKGFFSSRGAAKSITKEAKRGERMIGRDYKLVLVDTPGLFDTDTKDNMETAKILSSTVKKTKPGPHVFIFVLSMNSRYTTEEQAAIEFLKDLLGIHVTDYLIIVFTGKDTIDYEKIDLETYIDEADDDLKDLVSQSRGTVAINNRASPKDVDYTVDKILHLIKDVYLQNKKKYYTDELLEEAKKKFEEKLKKLEEEAHKRERELKEENEQLIKEKKDMLRDQRENNRKFEDLKAQIKQLEFEERKRNTERPNTDNIREGVMMMEIFEGYKAQAQQLNQVQQQMFTLMEDINRKNVQIHGLIEKIDKKEPNSGRLKKKEKMYHYVMHHLTITKYLLIYISLEINIPYLSSSVLTAL